MLGIKRGRYEPGVSKVSLMVAENSGVTIVNAGYIARVLRP